MCDSLLREVICDSINCVPLLLLAKQQRWAALEARCLQVALENPMDLGPELPSLPRDDMMHILGSDDLKVGDLIHHLLQCVRPELPSNHTMQILGSDDLKVKATNPHAVPHGLNRCTMTACQRHGGFIGVCLRKSLQYI